MTIIRDKTPTPKEVLRLGLKVRPNGPGIMITQNQANELIIEMQDDVSGIEPDLLALEKAGGAVSPELVNRVFRSVHSIKGAAGFCGFAPITKLSHAMENRLAQIRDHAIVPDTATIDALLAGLDKLKRMIADVACCDQVPFQDELARLARLTAAGSGPVTAGPLADGRCGGDSGCAPGGPERLRAELDCGAGRDRVAFNLERARLETAFTAEMYLQAFWVSDSADLNAKGRSRQDFQAVVEQCGLCLAGGANGTGPHSGAVEQPAGIQAYLLATVMQQELLAGILQIPQQQISTLDIADFSACQGLPAPATGAVAEPLPAPAAEAVEVAGVCGAVPETIKVGIALVDNLINLAGELVLGRNQLRQLIETYADLDPKIAPVMQKVDLVTSKVQEEIMKMRMQPLAKVLDKFPRIVRDLARQLHKAIDIHIEGAGVELDKSILEGLSNPLTHLVRNCADHGIEPAAERQTAGKPATGLIRVKAFHEGGRVNIEIGDDGRGLDHRHLVEKAVGAGLVDPARAARMDAKECLNLIFLPGFSTAVAVTDISGRGVGMDVVKKGIEALGGQLDIETTVGKGTVFHIVIPLTLAIIPSLILGAGGRRFAVPQINVKELVCVPAGQGRRKIETVAGAPVLRRRGRLLPLVSLAEVLGLEPGAADGQGALAGSPVRSGAGPEKDIYVVVLRLGNKAFGLCVDELFDNEEIVVKPLCPHTGEVKLFAGATIMGDGRVAMILDTVGIAAHARLRFGEIQAEESRRAADDCQGRRECGDLCQSFLIFSNCATERFALPLSRISRLMMVEARQITTVGRQAFLTYDGRGLPLIRLEDYLPVTALPENVAGLYVIIPKKARTPFGILVADIQDTVETVIAADPGGNRQGFAGAAVIADQLIFVIDIEALLDRVENAIGAGAPPRAPQLPLSDSAGETPWASVSL